MTVLRSVSVCLCVIACLAVLVFHDAVRTFVADALPKEQQFTELYFTDPDALPRTMAPDASERFSYGITNKTNTTQRYRVIVAVTANQRTLEVQNISIEVPAGSQVRRTVGFSLPADQLPAVVSVMLPIQNQSVHFSIQKGES